jgi:CRP-like cAMP-binding protein
MLTIFAGALGANLAGQLMSYLSGGDKCGAGAFKEKLRSVENYVLYRGLSDDVRAMVLLNYHTMWNRERRTNYSAESFLGLLSRPLAAEVALELNANIITMMVVSKHCRSPLHGRMALALRPQILLPKSVVYSANDTGHCVFFIHSGTVHVSLGKKERTLDDSETMAQSILEFKHDKLNCLHGPGTHFGEFCLLSALGLRLDDAVVMELSELYSFDKTAIWDLFRSMPFVERYRFIMSLFTETGSICYTESVIPSEDNEGRFDGDSLKVLYAIANIVVEDVMEALDADACSDKEDEKEDVVVRERRRQKRLMSVNSNTSGTSGDDISALVMGKTNLSNAWTRALMAYDKGKLRRKSSVTGLDLKMVRRQSMRRGSGGVPAMLLTAPTVVSSVSSVLEAMSDPDASEEQIKEGITKFITDVFLYMDKDKSGNIDRNELMLSLFDMGIEMSWSDVDEMIASADTNGNKLVSLEELIEVVLFELRNSRKQIAAVTSFQAPTSANEGIDEDQENEDEASSQYEEDRAP